LKTSLIWRRKQIQIQEAQRGPNKINPRRYTRRQIVTKMAKIIDKEIILKKARENRYIQENPFKANS